jgi:uncharacterized membrane protein YgdD (TMEM256/DUF423 family)
MTITRVFWVIAALCGGLSVGAGAFASRALQATLPDKAAWLREAVREKAEREGLI